ncbi:hypothetical protein Aperf_G00000033613 [Anoplocephala perfoliata]
MDELEPSTLGSKQYWNEYYIRELKNFEEFDDEGDIWFGKFNEQRMIKYLENAKTPHDVRILDVGCGNGHFCLELAKRGYSSVTGIDYSEVAINLANKLASKHELSCKVCYMCVNILSLDSVKEFCASSFAAYDVAIDKGTFDAITLIPDDTDPSKISEKVRDIYVQNIHHLLLPNGTFMITSCNWSADELLNEFERPQTTNKAVRKVFEFVYEVPPLNTFTFGGKTGADTVCLVFRRLELPPDERFVSNITIDF